VNNNFGHIHSAPREAVKFSGIFLCGWNVAYFVVCWLLWPVFKDVALGRCRWDVYTMVNSYQCFGGAYHLHLEVVASWRQYAPQKCWWHGVKCEKAWIFINTAARTTYFALSPPSVWVQASCTLAPSWVFPNKVLEASVMLVVLWVAYITFTVKVWSVHRTQMSLQEQKNWWLHTA